MNVSFILLAFFIIIILVILIIFIVRKRIKNREIKMLKLENALITIICMLEKMDLNNVLKRNNEKSSFITKVLKYLETRNRNDIRKLFDNLNIESDFSENYFGVILGNFLLLLLNNPIDSAKPSKRRSSLFIEENQLVSIEDNPMLNYFTKIKLRAKFSHIQIDYVQVYAYNTEFEPDLHKMVETIFYSLRDFAFVDPTYSYDDLKFGEYLIFFFTDNIDKDEFKELLNDKLIAFGYKFKLLFVGVSDLSNSTFKVLDENVGFLVEDDTYTYDFVVFKNLGQIKLT